MGWCQQTSLEHLTAYILQMSTKKNLPQRPSGPSFTCSVPASSSIYVCLPYFPPHPHGLYFIQWVTSGQTCCYATKSLRRFWDCYHSGSPTGLLSAPSPTFSLVHQIHILPHKSETQPCAPRPHSPGSCGMEYQWNEGKFLQTQISQKCNNLSLLIEGQIPCTSDSCINIFTVLRI